MKTAQLEDRDALLAKQGGQVSNLVYVWDLLYTLVARDLKLRYKRSVLGVAWSLLNPLAQLLVFRFVFQTVLPLNIPNYTLFLFTGLLPWTWFSTALYQATDSIVSNRELLSRPGFPPGVLPLVTVASHLVHFVLALPVLVISLMVGGIPLSASVVLLVLIIPLQFVFTLSLAYLVSTFHVTFRDTQYLLGIALLLAFYLTPVFYDPTVIPERYRLIYILNPMFHLIEGYRAILLKGELPDLAALAILTVASTLLLVLGYRFFRRASHRFVEEI
jgi:lipopolysaccharide transport system permease protein